MDATRAGDTVEGVSFIEIIVKPMASSCKPNGKCFDNKPVPWLKESGVNVCWKRNMIIDQRRTLCSKTTIQH